MTTAGRPFIRLTARWRSSSDSTRGWRISTNSWSGNCASSAVTRRAAVSPVASETTWSSTGVWAGAMGASLTRGLGSLTRMAEPSETVTMDKIVSLCKRRGFVFPSSEIYGGLGSTFDYGHYGVLMKNNIRAEWFRSMVQERDDMVALDSAVILNPRVWEASGHVAGFSDPLVDCKTCKLRFRADRLEDSQCGKRPSKRPGEDAQCELTEARQFNLMFSTQVGAMEDASSQAFLPPETAQGIFI